MRAGAFNATLAKYRLERPINGRYVTISVAATTPKKIRAIGRGALRQGYAFECVFHFRVQREPDCCTVLDSMKEDPAVLHPVTFERCNVRHPEPIKTQ